MKAIFHNQIWHLLAIFLLVGGLQIAVTHFGLMVLYLPGLLFLSQLALIVALFNHLYIWIHYYCTELPDLKVIYAETESTRLTKH